MLDQLPLSLPTVAIAGGVLLLLWSQGGRFVGLLAKLRSAPKTEADLTPHELFERLYALRTWCETVGQAEAVKALDTSVLPAIVRGTAAPVAAEGGPKS
jgi:hypothetical protein